MANTCIIIPCYNEEKRLPCEEVVDFISKNDVHFTFVNDGSSDNTIQILNSMKEQYPKKIRVLDNGKNKGKAESIRSVVLTCLNQSDYQFIGYFDADLSTPLSEIKSLLCALEINSSYEFTFGSRVLKLGSVIERSSTRHYLSRVFATIASKILDLPVYDTQCGAKCFKADLAKNIFKDPFLTKWLFDIELFARTKKLRANTQPFIEVPLFQWIDKGDSKIKLKDIILFPFELLRIKQHYF